MQQAKNGDKVKVHYHGKLTNGETFDSSAGRAPLEFEIGNGTVIKGFDIGVRGMIAGEKKTINISYDNAYGPKSPEMMIEFPKEKFPKDLNIEPGLELMICDESGQKFQIIVSQVKEETVILDANHPMAGQDLVFDIELVEIVGGNPLIIMPN